MLTRPRGFAWVQLKKMGAKAARERKVAEEECENLANEAALVERERKRIETQRENQQHWQAQLDVSRRQREEDHKAQQMLLNKNNNAAV